MEKKPKNYWGDFSPIWWNEIKLWFGWTDWLNATIKTGIQLGSIFLVFILGGNAENFLDAVLVKVAEWIITILLFQFVLTITYLRASQKLYSIQKETEQVKGKEISELQSRMDAIENSKPVIFVEGPKIDKGKGFSDGSRIDAVYIDVSNRPKIKNGNIAEKVYPTVTWYDVNGKTVVQNSGRWHIGNPKTLPGDPILKQVVDLDPNGNSRWLHFALDNLGKDTFFAWSRKKDGNDDLYELTEESYKVRIHLQANNYAEIDIECLVEKHNGQLFVQDVKREKRKNKK